MEKEYICDCGKEFKSQKSLSAHMASCKEHYLQRDGNLNNYNSRQKNLSKSKIERDKKLGICKEENLKIWFSEEHRCERCGKIMTEFYGSGRFCSQSCANSHDFSEDTKKALSIKLSNYAKNNPKGWASKEWLAAHPEFINRHRKIHSKRELEIVDLLQNKFPEDNWKQGPITDRPLYETIINPDLYSDKLQIVLEYDGIWHFKDIHNQLQRKQEYDRLTLYWCQKYDYRLIRIDYELNLTDEEIIDIIYNSDENLELCNSNKYNYLFINT